MATSLTPVRIRLRKGSASKVAGFYSATRDRVMPPPRAYYCSAAYIVTGALLDRLTHHVHILEWEGRKRYA